MLHKAIGLNLKIHFLQKTGIIFSLLLDAVLLIFKIQIFKAIYSNNHSELVLGYTLPQMIWYFAGINFANYLIWNYADLSLSSGVISGNIMLQLTKPVPLIRLEFSKALALIIYRLLFEFIPSFFIYMLFTYPDFLTVFAFIKYFIITLLSFVLLFSFNFLIGISAFKIKSIDALSTLKNVIIYFMAGTSLPFEFYPDFIQRFIKFLPFQYICYVPIQFLLNRPETRGWQAFIATILMQLFWILVFYLAYRLVWEKMIRRYCAPGS